MDSVNLIRPGRVWVLLFILPLLFRVFRYFPILSSVEEVWYVACFLYLVVVYPHWSKKPFRGISQFEWYIIALIVLVPAVSAIEAWRAYGQPLIYGLLANRYLAGLAGVLFLIRGMRRQYFSFDEIERALLILAWGTFFLYLVMRLTINPENYIGVPGFVNVNEGGAALVLLIYFILFAFFHYFFRGFRNRSFRHYATAWILIVGSTSLNHGWRGQTVTILATLAILCFRWSKSARFTSLVIKIAICLVAGVSLFAYLEPDAAAGAVQNFSAAVTVAFTGSSVGDPSANARLEESLFAVEGIVKHPLLGNGTLSNQWEGGPRSVTGEYFYFDDIGLLGVLYLLGIFGVVLYYAGQYFHIFRALKRLPPGRSSALLDAVKAVILWELLISFTSPGLVEDASVTLFYIAILYAMGTMQSMTPEFVLDNAKLSQKALPAR